jgi:tRNA threonylcarbamoyladenosine modification (KEOPS) complex  Pcc1 subunit
MPTVATDGGRRATIRTVHDRPAVVAAAIAPDNTEEMSTRLEADRNAVVTTIERETTGGLRTTVDDYVANLTVAQRITDTTTRS